MSKLLLLIALLPAVCTPAFAIYRCDAGGTTSYSDAPCPGGKLVAAPHTQPSAADAQQAQRQLTEKKEQLQRLENERQRQEAAEDRQQRQRARAAAAQRKKCAASALRVQWAEQDARQAAGKSVPKAAQKARRAAEKHELECGK